MAAKKEITAVAEVKTGAMTSATDMFEEDAGGGFENADAESYAIPFLAILQSGSPQCKKSEGAYIKGAEEGMLFNTVTQDLFDGEEGLEVVPCYYKRSFTKWEDSDKPKFRGEVAPSDPVVSAGRVNSEGHLIDNEGNLLVDTRTHYVLVLTQDGGFSPAVISMSSTQIKKSRQWMSKMNNIKMKRADGSAFTPPMFSHKYKVTTVPESNDKGAWMGWKLELVEPLSDKALYAAAKEFRAAVSSGEVKEQVPSATEEVSDSDQY